MQITHDDIINVLCHALSNHLIWATAHGDKPKDIAVIHKILDAVAAGQLAIGPDADFPAEVARVRRLMDERGNPAVAPEIIAEALLDIGIELRLPDRLRHGLACLAAHAHQEIDEFERMTEEYLLREAIAESEHHPRH